MDHNGTLQFTLSTFGLVWLISGAGWATAAAGAVIAASQVIGALGRIAVGYLSDRVGSRVRILRWVAVSGVVMMLALAATGALHWTLAAGVVLVFAATVSVADNGLAFTSVTEAAGPGRSGKALGVQNTAQFLAAAVGPGVGALLAAVGYPVDFALVALTPLASIPLVPARDKHYDPALRPGRKAGRAGSGRGPHLVDSLSQKRGRAGLAVTAAVIDCRCVDGRDERAAPPKQPVQHS